MPASERPVICTELGPDWYGQGLPWVAGYMEAGQHGAAVVNAGLPERAVLLLGICGIPTFPSWEALLAAQAGPVLWCRPSIHVPAQGDPVTLWPRQDVPPDMVVTPGYALAHRCLGSLPDTRLCVGTPAQIGGLLGMAKMPLFNWDEAFYAWASWQREAVVWADSPPGQAVPERPLQYWRRFYDGRFGGVVRPPVWSVHPPNRPTAG